MEGLSRRCTPPVERFFVSSRLAEDLLSSVYERLLGTEWRAEKVVVRGRAAATANAATANSGNEGTEQEAMVLVSGGRS